MLRLDIPLAGEIMLATLPFADAKRWGRGMLSRKMLVSGMYGGGKVIYEYT